MKRFAFFGLWLVPFSGLVLACGPSGGPTYETTRRDSAGITIVENRGESFLLEDGWGVSPEPVLSIGTVKGEEAYQFFGVSGLHRFLDGRIAVVNAGTREVRIFASNGAHLRTFGQRGGGPEEFEMPVLAGAGGDTLRIVDPAHHRFTFLHSREGFVAVNRVSDEVGGWLNAIGTFANGETVFGGAFDMRRRNELRNGMNRAHTFYRSAAADGSLAADFGHMTGAEFFIKDLEGSGPDARPALIPFARVPVGAVSPHYFFFSDQDAYEIQVYEPSGALVRLVRLERDPVRVTPEDGAGYIREEIEDVGDPGESARISARLEALPLPEFFPPHGILLADTRDFLWVEDFRPPGVDTRSWTIFDSEGGLTGRIALPFRFYPFEIGEDYILGMARDEMDVEYVRLYELQRPEPRT